MEVEEVINTDLGKIDKCYEEVEMRQNREKCKAMVLEKTTDNPGVESDNTVIAIENKLSLIGSFCGYTV